MIGGPFFAAEQPHVRASKIRRHTDVYFQRCAAARAWIADSKVTYATVVPSGPSKSSDSEPERLLRAVLKFTRGKQALFSGSILEDGNTQMKLLENLKKEFRLTRIYWRQIFDSVAGVDELNMCTMRLRLRMEGEDVAETRERREGAPQ